MHDLVRSYLVHYAFVETLQAYEEEDRPVPKGQVVFPGLSDTQKRQVADSKKMMSPPKMERRMTDGEGTRLARFSSNALESPVPIERESAGLEDIEISEKSSPDKVLPENDSPLPFKCALAADDNLA